MAKVDSFVGMNPLEKRYNLKYIAGDKNTAKNINITNLKNTLAHNKIFAKSDIDYYNKVSRHGYINLYETNQITKEYLFFTKPDLNLFDGSNYDSDLIPYLKTIPFFTETNLRNKNALRQLQLSLRDEKSKLNPFMYLLTNTVNSKLDLPSITAETRESTENNFGATIQYRGHSHKSDNGYDFSLSFTDNSNLDIYHMVKAYDEYIRLLKMGEVEPKEHYILSKIIPEQFSIFKFIVGEDGETILYYAKLTGCFFTDVPRSDMADPGNEGFKYSVSFHAQFVEDSNPLILSDFNRLTADKCEGKPMANTYDYENNVVDNIWVRYPIIIIANNDDPQVLRRGIDHDYRLKWILED